MAELEEVLVTARRREESLTDVPIAITALDGDALREMNVAEMSDLALHVPSLSVSTGGPSTNMPVVALRGQRPGEVLLTLDAAVPMYFAEVVLTPGYGTNLGLYDLADVQVLKGPQGTLFGRNSTGGAMLLTPQTPGQEFGGYAEAKIGDYNLYQFEGAVDLPVSDTLAVRLAGRSVDRDGYQSNVADNALRGDDEYWDEDSYGLRLTAKFTPTDRLSNLTTVSYDENDMLARRPLLQAFNASAGLGQLMNAVHNGGLSGLFGTPVAKKIDEALERQRRRDWTDVESDVNATETVENWFAANTTEFELSDDLRIKNIFGYRDVDYRYNTDPDGTAVPLIGARTSNTGWVTFDAPLGKVEAEQYSEELQLLGNAFDDRLEWIVGAFWFRMEGSEIYPSQITGANPDWPRGPSPIDSADLNLLWKVGQDGWFQDAPNNDVENEAWAVFGEGTFTLNEQWSVTLGARQSWDDRAMTTKNFTLNRNTLQVECQVLDENNVQLPDDACARDVDESFDHATWRASVNYTPTEDMLLYGSVSTGYRSGGFNGRGISNATLEPFDEETVTTYEFGHKTDWQLGDVATMRTSLALYFQSYDDIQKTVAGQNPATGEFETYTINAAEAEIQGAELDVLVAPTESLLLSLAWSWVDASYNEWDRDVQLPGGTVTVDNTKANFVYIPENSLTSSVRYTLPLDPSIGEVSLLGSVYWQDEMHTNDLEWLWPSLGWSAADLAEVQATAIVDDYAVWNFRIDWMGVMGSGFDVAAFVNNAADEDYVTGGLSVPDSLGLVASTMGPPRTYGASLRYRF